MRTIIAATILLTGCVQEPTSEKIRAQALEMYEAGASKEDQCAITRKLSETYADEGNMREALGTAAEARLICE